MKKKAQMVTLFIMTCIAFVIGCYFGFFEIYDCPTCIAIMPLAYGQYAFPICLLLLIIVLLFRFFVLEKDEIKAKQAFSGIANAMFINMLTNPLAFWLGCWIGAMCNPYNWHNWH